MGCGAEAEGDPELTVYLSAPISGPGADDGRDIADAAELALADAAGSAAGIAVRLEVLDDADRDGWDAALAGANARAAAQDSTAIAYLGELESGATRTSLPITNEAGLLQVSAGSGAEDLTAAAIGSEQVQALTQPSGARTFGRLIPSDVRQGEAAGEWMGDEGLASVELVDSDDEFSESLVSGFESSASGSSTATAGPARGAEAAYYALADLVPAQGGVIPGGKDPIYGSDALLDPDDLTSFRILTEACSRPICPVGPREIRLTSAALDPAQLPPAAADFLAAFEQAYDRAPGRYAAYGYEAMALVLDSIERSEDPLDRSSVVDAFFATTDRESILGTYSIDDVGDTTLAQLGAYEVIRGRARPEPEPLELP